jgi:hypothetical protein
MENSTEYQILSAKQDSALVDSANKRIHDQWPEFMLHDPVADCFTDLYEKLPEFQFVLIKPGSSEPLAIGNSIPLAWHEKMEDLPNDGWDWAMTKGIDDLKAGRVPNILCALQVVVFNEFRGRGISRHVVAAMREIGKIHGLNGLIAPVRPSKLCDYPLTPIDDYIKWTGAEDCPFDPWLRVHFNLGARIIKPCPTAMRITGTVAEWESWTDMRFPGSGKYIVPGALVPVQIDLVTDSGTYIEPNVWMYHPNE